MRPATLAAALLLAALPARSEPGGHELSLGYSRITTDSFFSLSPELFAVEVAYHRTLGWPREGMPLRVGGGLRSAGMPEGGGLPAEIFGEAQLVARIGHWAPAAGVQLGWSPYTKVFNGRDYRPSDFFDLEQARVSGLFAGFTAAPLRLQFGRWMVSALELQLGTTLAPPGRAARTQITYLQLGGML